MIECNVSDICAATGCALIAGDAATRVAGVSIDSRTVGRDGLFVAFRGERVDGNAYLSRAAESGAAAVVCSAEPDPGALARLGELGCCVLRADADDPQEFLLRLAACWRAGNSWLVVGVTGSVGKTTTKDMLACALSCRWRTHATAGNLNNLIGVPLTLLSAPTDAQALVVEMGMNHPGEIARLAAVARPQLAVITNVGTSHIGLLGSREGIARAKAEIVAPLAQAPESDPACEPRLFLLDGGDYMDLIEREYAGPAHVAVEHVGADGSVSAHGVTLDDQARPSFALTLPDGTEASQTLGLTGSQVVPDYELALAVALHLGIDARAAREALGGMRPTRMRTQVVRATCGCRVIDDSYNASPDSTAAALDALCAMEVGQGGRRIAVVGEIGELGDEAVRLHELVGAYCAAKPLDMLVIVGTERADAMERACRLMGFSDDRIVRVADVDALIDVVAPILAASDLVLVKASRAAALDRFVKAVSPAC